MIEQTESTPNGIDRRSALKKVAVGGAVAWSVPTVLSSRVSAAGDACTLKCAPDIASQEIVIEGAKGPCVGGAPPGSQNREFDILSVDVGGSAACGCGGDAVVTFTPETLTYTDPDTSQGVRTVTIGQITVTTTCLDRQDRPVTTVCTVDVVATFSGSCEGVGNTGFGSGVVTSCDVFCG